MTKTNTIPMILFYLVNLKRFQHTLNLQHQLNTHTQPRKFSFQLFINLDRASFVDFIKAGCLLYDSW